MTLSISTLCIMTLRITTLYVMTLSISTLCVITLSISTLCVITLRITILYAEKKNLFVVINMKDPINGCPRLKCFIEAKLFKIVIFHSFFEKENFIAASAQISIERNHSRPQTGKTN
jgi:hypothetical protein